MSIWLITEGETLKVSIVTEVYRFISLFYQVVKPEPDTPPFILWLKILLAFALILRCSIPTGSKKIVIIIIKNKKRPRRTHGVMVFG